MPAVQGLGCCTWYDQDDAIGVALVPHLVLEAVVEDQALALPPLAGLLAHTYAHAGRHEQPQVAAEALRQGGERPQRGAHS